MAGVTAPPPGSPNGGSRMGRDKTELAQDISKAIAQSQQEFVQPPGQKLGIALVGLGRSGRFHLESIRSLPEIAKLVWAVDIDVRRAQCIGCEMDCHFSASLEPALADPAVHAVIIASTTDTHFRFIMQCLQANKAVFAEKPISHEVKEVQEAVDLALKRNLPFVCGYQRRCDGNFRTLKLQLEKGAIGQLKVIKSCSRDNPVPPMDYLRTSGGIFQDMLIHDFDMQDWLSGGQVPEAITAVGHCYDPEIEKMNDLDTVAVLVKYKSGLLSMVDTCRDAAYGYDQRVEAFGSKGMLAAKNEMTSSVELATADGHLMPPAMWSFPERYKQAYNVELAEFVALVRAGPDSEALKIEHGHMKRHPRIVKTALAAELSWKLNRQIFLSEDLDALRKQAERASPEEKRRKTT